VAAVRLAIVGSTRFANPYGPQVAEWMIKRALMFFDPEVVISGRAEGVDTLAEILAMTYGFSTCVYPPTHPRWEPRGYKARNLRIAHSCTHLLAIRCGESKTYGSGWTYQQAKIMGKPAFMRIIDA